MTYTATYSPDDNKLRLYASARLDADTYARVRAAGFIWAPKQALFVAPMWTPKRADLLVELAGEIGDEDTSLVDRAEDRAERFGEYSEKRAADADSARQAAARIMDGIPLGQPILIGHHSERHARKDAERIERGIRRAVHMWETSKYWTARAAGAVRHAKYKERPDVRHRRIKGLEADKRRQVKARDEARAVIKLWGQLHNPRKDGRPCDDALRQSRALYISNYFSSGIGTWSELNAGTLTPRAAQLRSVKARGQIIAHAMRWIAHLDNRLAYERAMLTESGGLITDRTEYPIAVGGRVLIGREWLAVIRVNRKDGAIVSVTTNARYVRVRGIEEVQDYQPPTAEDAAAVAAKLKLPPLCNYPSDDAVSMTAAEFKARTRASDFAGVRRVEATATAGAHRRRFVPGSPCWDFKPAFLTDEKRKDPPPPASAPPPTLATVPALDRRPDESIADYARRNQPTDEAAAYDAMKATLQAGVRVVAVPQLFPTPRDLARRVVDLADIRPGHRILEPSAGTGALVVAAIDRLTGPDCGRIIAVEIDPRLAGELENDRARRLYATESNYGIVCGDFLTCEPQPPEAPHSHAYGTRVFGLFDRIIMNPPFVDAADIRHIQHARRFLRPDGRLVAICANGPRQRAALKPIAAEWIDLPPGSFEAAGTNINAAIVVLEAAA